MKFDKITLHTNDLASITDFYANVLALKLVKSTKTTVSFHIGTTTLTFKLSTIPNPTYHYAINIPENQFEAARNWLRERTTTISYDNSDKIDFPHWNAHAIYFYDSAGNIVELIARHGLDNATNQPFTTESLLCISEIGLPTSNVLVLKEALNQVIGIKTYISGGENFQPLGDENGLFICVILDRNWFPTTLKAVDYPVEIVIQHDKKIDFKFGNYHITSV